MLYPVPASNLASNIVTLTFACMLLGSPTPAAAHPHVWIDYLATIQFERGSIIAIQEQWSFDRDFSTIAMQDLPGGPSTKILGPRDIAILHDKDFNNLKNYGYFNHVWTGKAVVPIASIAGFDAALRGGKLVYSFTLNLAKPVDPRQTVADIGIWDDSFYVDVEPVEKKVIEVSGDGSTGCKAQAVEDKAHSIYYGMVTPLTIHVRCAAQTSK